MAAISLTLMAIACQVSSTTDVSVGVTDTGQSKLLAEPEWLEANLGRDGLVILDVRSRAMYTLGHVPGAVNLNPRDLHSDKPVRGMAGPAEQVEQALERLGVNDDDQVVIYDDDRGMWAARVFWILEYYGKTGVGLLNGGFARWRAEGYRVTAEVPDPTAGSLGLVPNEDRFASKERVQEALGRSGVVFLDARTPREYSGETALSARGGRIPGATNVPWEETLTRGEPSVFKSMEDLSVIYRNAGVSHDSEIITYCQTAVRAAHAYFTLRLAGFSNVRVYDGSWEEWGNDPDLPLE